jgi:hypothetical protein
MQQLLRLLPLDLCSVTFSERSGKEVKTKYMIVSATQKGRQTQNWKVGDEVFERVSSFKYLGKVIHKEGRISGCVKDRTQVGNRAHAANHHMLKRKIIKRSAKMHIQGYSK